MMHRPIPARDIPSLPGPLRFLNEQDDNPGGTQQRGSHPGKINFTFFPKPLDTSIDV